MRLAEKNVVSEKWKYLRRIYGNLSRRIFRGNSMSHSSTEWCKIKCTKCVSFLWCTNSIVWNSASHWKCQNVNKTKYLVVQSNIICIKFAREGVFLQYSHKCLFEFRFSISNPISDRCQCNWSFDLRSVYWKSLAECITISVNNTMLTLRRSSLVSNCNSSK